jgi:hypothetical protein
MDAEYSFYVKNIETHVRTFLPLNISAIGTVIGFVKQRKLKPTLETNKQKSMIVSKNQEYQTIVF